VSDRLLSVMAKLPGIDIEAVLSMALLPSVEPLCGVKRG